MASPQETAAQGLLKYCGSVGISINPSLKAKHVPGAGTGIYTTATIKEGKAIVTVPTKHIFTTANIPGTFLSKEARKGIAVHTQLAAYLAFGDVDQQEHFRVWKSTWPDFDDFLQGMPIFWKLRGEQISHFCNNLREEDCETERGAKRRKLNSTKDPTNSDSPISLSPGLTGWTRLDSTSTDPTMIDKMIAKLTTHIASIASAKPELNLTQPSQLVKFLYMWCIVNTRCFYYIPPGKKSKAIRDPNEAMALCPFMDLFNHVSEPGLEPYKGNQHLPKPCKAKYTAFGFEVITGQAMRAGEQVFLSYGTHDNDMLWAEYGFMLAADANLSDSVRLDDVVLPQFSKEDQSALAAAEYLGDYTVTANRVGVCYRTIMAGWMKIFGRHKWAKIAAEYSDPQNHCETPDGKWQFMDLIESWLRSAQIEAGSEMERVRKLSDKQVLDCFGTISVVAGVVERTELEELAMAYGRRDMCLARWKQIQDMLERQIDDLSFTLKHALLSTEIDSDADLSLLE